MGPCQSRKMQQTLDPQTLQLHRKITESACKGAKEETYKRMGMTDAQVARVDWMIAKYLREMMTVEKEGLDRRAIIAVMITQGRKRGVQTDKTFYKACLPVFNVLYELN